MKKSPHGWLDEITGHSFRTSLALEEVRFQGRTHWQNVLIAYNSEVGSFLALDGQLQSASLDEFIYHEVLVHSALIQHPNPRNVLILGGGEGATLREVLRHPTVERVVMVELDGQLVELCRRHLPEFSAGSFEDPRVELVIGDAWAWLISNTHRFDVIVSDLTEPEHESHSLQLFSKQFFETAKSRLEAGGLLTLQASHGSWGYLHRHRRVRQLCQRSFPSVHSLLVPIPSFGGSWGFLLAESAPKAQLPLSAEAIQTRLRERGLSQLGYICGETLVAIGSHPPCVADFLDDRLDGERCRELFRP